MDAPSQPPIDLASLPARIAGAGCFVLDMDGTTFLGERLLPGAADFVALLRRRGTPFLFLTNNSAQSAAGYAAKLERMGLAVSAGEIFTSGEATARYLAARAPGARLFVAGTPALRAELAAHGFRLVRARPDFAVLGFDTTLTYARLRRLCDLVRAGVPFIATHPDVNCPVPGGFIPDTGAMLALVKASTGRDPDVIVGKPNPPVVAALEARTGLPAARMAMVGDRLYTDIAMGASGMATVLVLSGETRLADVPGAPHPPDLVVADLGELARRLGG